MLLPGNAALFVLVFTVREDQSQEVHCVGIVHFCDRRPARHRARLGPMGPAGQRETQARDQGHVDQPHSPAQTESPGSKAGASCVEHHFTVLAPLHMGHQALPMPHVFPRSYGMLPRLATLVAVDPIEHLSSINAVGKVRAATQRVHADRCHRNDLVRP